MSYSNILVQVIEEAKDVGSDIQGLYGRLKKIAGTNNPSDEENRRLLSCISRFILSYCENPPTDIKWYIRTDVCARQKLKDIIQKTAYRMWEERGRPIGDDDADWFSALDGLSEKAFETHYNTA